MKHHSRSCGSSNDKRHIHSIRHKHQLQGSSNSRNPITISNSPHHSNRHSHSTMCTSLHQNNSNLVVTVRQQMLK